MKWEEILAISGKPGLYRLVARTRQGIIAESMMDGKRNPVSATQQVSTLKDIAIFTYEQEVPLKEVLLSVHREAEAGNLPDKKADQAALHAFMATVLPNYDREKVYSSDIKKIIGWYGHLRKEGWPETEETTSEGEVIQNEAEASHAPAEATKDVTSEIEGAQSEDEASPEPGESTSSSEEANSKSE